MNRSELRDAVDRHGEDLSTWPHSERHEAIQLLANEPDARCVLDEARAMRALIAGHASIHAPVGLADRIVKAALCETAPTAKRPRPAKAAVSS
jgi:hypothetical protein